MTMELWEKKSQEVFLNIDIGVFFCVLSFYHGMKIKQWLQDEDQQYQNYNKWKENKFSKKKMGKKIYIKIVDVAVKKLPSTKATTTGGVGPVGWF